MNKDQKKDILNYESQYGKDLHKKDLMEDVRKKEIKKYEKDHERGTKERTNIYVDNLNIDKFDNTNYGNNINAKSQGNLNLNLDWSIKSSEPLSNNNGLQLQKSNNIKEEEIINSKIYKDMENNYKEALNKLKEKESFINKLIDDKRSLINLIKHFKGKVLSDDIFDTIKILMFGGVDDDEK